MGMQTPQMHSLSLLQNNTRPALGPLCTTALPLLYKQKVHREVGEDHKHARKYTQPNHISPQRHHIKPKRAQDGRPRHLDINAVLVVHERQVLDFVDNKSFESVVENGQLSTRSAPQEWLRDTGDTYGLQPARKRRDTSLVQEEPREKQAE